MPSPEERAAAAARRAERKRARVHAPAPERNPALASLTLAQLRAVRAELTEEETRVSYWRRIVQARLDLLRAGEPTGDTLATLRTVLADARGSSHRLVHLTVAAAGELPAVPDLGRLWASDVDPADTVAVARLVADLDRAERDLSGYRADLHRRLDAITAELIARYRDDPLQALSALPTRPGPRG